MDRKRIFEALRAENIGVQVHYIPIHYHRYYRETWGYEVGWFPTTEKYYAECLSLPIFPAMTESDTQSAIDGVRKVLAAYRA